MKKYIILSILFLFFVLQLQAQTFVYDRKSQLIGIDYDTFAISYTYDKLGNRIAVHRGAEIVLPIGLKNFSGAVADCSVHLNWQSTDEATVASYEVQRSINNGRSFAAIASVSAMGQGSYSYQDKQAPKGNIYYRLAIKNMDASVSYSQIVPLVNTCNVLQMVKMFPNPTAELLIISFTSAAANLEAQFVIVDIKGRPVLTTAFTTNGGAEVHNISVAALASGTYICRLYLGNNKEAEEKIVIVK